MSNVDRAEFAELKDVSDIRKQGTVSQQHPR